MGLQTTLSGYLDTTDGKTALDECCKRLLSTRIILAWIMKCTMKEYRDYGPEEICSRFIEETPTVTNVAVHQDTESNTFQKNSEPENSVLGKGLRECRIHGDNTVDESITEGTVTYDIRFRAIVPGSGSFITLIINVEAQANFRPGYPLLKRGIYYGSRLISSQYGTEFQQSHYEKLKKVYTIWICTNPPRARRHSLNKYEITEHSIIGSYSEPEDHYDLLSVIMICLGETKIQPGCSPEDQIIDLLTVLLSTELDAAHKKHHLETVYGIPATEELDKEMMQMCNYSDYVEQIGMEKGRKKGLIETCKELGVSKDTTLNKLMVKFALTQSAAEELLNKYW